MPEVWRNSTVPGRQEERVRINMGFEKKIDVTALGELLIDFTQNGVSEQGNNLFEANPGGAPCNVLAMLNKAGKKTAFIGKVGRRSHSSRSFLTATETSLSTEIPALISCSRKTRSWRTAI